MKTLLRKQSKARILKVPQFEYTKESTKPIYDSQTLVTYDALACKSAITFRIYMLNHYIAIL